ncbi:MAG: hypothetical protein L0338_11780, partial [Acidobacteria bacterium]|nr:hypothetical protein [Acidobacteriota bacterium]
MTATRGMRSGRHEVCLAIVYLHLVDPSEAAPTDAGSAGLATLSRKTSTMVAINAAESRKTIK